MLKLNNVTKKFGGLTAANNITLEVSKDDIFGLIGPNGAGKTTLFNMISGVYKPTSGKIFFKDHPIVGLFPFEINKLGIARTYQNINLFNNMTVLENVMVGRHAKLKSSFISIILDMNSQKKEEKILREKCLEILDFAGLADKANYLAKNLSYGEQRMLEISRALASEPTLLLLDEPAAGMNLTEKNSLIKTIQEIRSKHITIFIVEHNMKLIMDITDKIFVMNFGEKIAMGKPKYIQKNPDVIKAYLGGN